MYFIKKAGLGKLGLGACTINITTSAVSTAAINNIRVIIITANMSIEAIIIINIGEGITTTTNIDGKIGIIIISGKTSFNNANPNYLASIGY